jgi:hypothetical protein
MVNRAVDIVSARQRVVRRVDDRIDIQGGDVGVNDSGSRCGFDSHTLETSPYSPAVVNEPFGHCFEVAGCEMRALGPTTG